MLSIGYGNKLRSCGGRAVAVNTSPAVGSPTDIHLLEGDPQMHLVMDGYGADAHRLQDESLVRELLDTYPDAIGMTKISEPLVHRYTEGRVPTDWGVSGFVLIAESHISVHTFPDRGYLNVDIFSCKTFDADLAVNELRGRFGITDVKTQVLDRGLEEFQDKQEAAELSGAGAAPNPTPV